jgi:hypothetical protein
MSSNLKVLFDAVKAELDAVDPKTWVEHTASGLSYHIAQALGDLGIVKEDPKPEPPLKTVDCGGRYWHDEHVFSIRTPKGTKRLHCEGRS